MSHRATLPITISMLLSGCLIDHHDDGYPQRVDALLDDSDVTLTGALEIAEREVARALPVGARLDVWSERFDVELWRGDTLLGVEVSRGGTVVDVDDYGFDERAEDAASVLGNAEVSLYDAIEIASGAVDGARAFDAMVDGAFVRVEILADLDVYAVWIAPEDGTIVDIDLESEFGHVPAPLLVIRRVPPGRFAEPVLLPERDGPLVVP